MNDHPRALLRAIPAQPTSDGAGVRINRVMVPGALAALDPFLLLDEIAADDAADYRGGFPDHPHRGFETVTYLLAGRMRHRDHLGNEGLLEAGDVQWMTAGRGVIHSEMPEIDEGRLHGFQLWLNLPAAEKLREPGYRDLRADELPHAELPGGGRIKAIAGALAWTDGRLQGPMDSGTTAAGVFDIELGPGQSLHLAIDGDRTVLLYPYAGALRVPAGQGNTTLERGVLGLFGAGHSLALEAGAEGARALLLTGRPLREPIANWGPFVMNTHEEIEQAIADYRDGRLTAPATT